MGIRAAATSKGGETRDRIVHATADLIRRQGYPGTGLKQISAASGAPFGSLYHFFPGGKEELVAEAIRFSGQGYLELCTGILDNAPDPVTGIDDAFTGAAEVLAQSGYADACPIATVALEVAGTSEPLRQVTAEVFDSWIDAMAERFVAAGLADDAARALAVQALSALEGAFVLARTLRSKEPVLAAGRLMVAAMRSALGLPAT